MESKLLIKDLVKLQILCIRWVERNTNLRCSTHRDMDRILTNNKLTCTYAEGLKNLKVNILKYCKESSYLTENIIALEERMNNSSIKNFRFGLEPQLKFTNEEKDLSNYMLERTFFMINEMVGIKYITEKYDLTESAVKQACQQQRLLNTQKIGKTWIVHIPEVINYWNLKEEDDKRLYKDFKY